MGQLLEAEVWTGLSPWRQEGAWLQVRLVPLGLMPQAGVSSVVAMRWRLEGRMSGCADDDAC